MFLLLRIAACEVIHMLYAFCMVLIVLYLM